MSDAPPPLEESPARTPDLFCSSGLQTVGVPPRASRAA